MLIPNLELKNGIWRGRIELESWNRFFGCDKCFELNIGGDEKTEFVENKHKMAYEYVVSNQKKLLERVLSKLLVDYKDLQNAYGYEEDELAELMPEVININDFGELLLPKRVYSLNVEMENMSYFGFHFECNWDDEHGIGVMMHKDRIIKMGNSECAFLTWIARQDINQLGSE